MPVTYYSEEEYSALQYKNKMLSAQVEVAELMLPMRNVSDHLTAAALAEVWRILSVNNQTDCIAALYKHIEQSSRR